MDSQEFFGGYMKMSSLSVLFLSSFSISSLYCMEELIIHRHDPFQQPALPIITQAQQIQFDQRITLLQNQIQATQRANVLPGIPSEKLSQDDCRAIEAALTKEINLLILITNQVIAMYDQGLRSDHLAHIFRQLFNRFNLFFDSREFRQGLNIHVQRLAKKMSLHLGGYIRNL